MLAKPYRLRQNRDFATVYKQGMRCSSDDLSLRAYRRSDQYSASVTRIGICISQKVSKRATYRNRIKRQLRAASRSLLKRLLPGWDVVIVVRPSALQCDYHQFLQQLERLFTDVELLEGRYSGGG